MNQYYIYFLHFFNKTEMKKYWQFVVIMNNIINEIIARDQVLGV